MPSNEQASRKKAQIVLQMEAAECGAACLAMVLGAHKRFVTLEEARARCGVGRDGASVPSIVRAAAEYGLSAKALRRDPETLADLPLPAILHWNFEHFVVLESLRGGRFNLLDPAAGPRTVDSAEMGRSFTGIALAFAPGPEFEQGGHRPSTLGALTRWSIGSWDALGLVMLLGIIGVVPGLIASGAVSTFATYVVGQERPVWLYAVIAALAAATLAQGFIAWMRARIVASLKAKVAAVVSARTFEHALFLPLKFFAQRDAAELVSRLRVGSEIGGTIAGPLAQLAPTIITGIVYIAVIALYDPVLGASVAAVALVNGAVLAHLSQRMAGSARLSNLLQGAASGVATSGFASFSAFRLLGREGLLFHRWLNAEEAALDAEQRLGIHRILATLGPNASELLIAIVVLGVGAARTMAGDMSLGDLLALQVLAGFAAGPVSAAAQQLCAMQQSAGPLNRLDDITNHPLDPVVKRTPAIAQQVDLEPRSTVLELNRVAFGFEAGPLLFSDVSLRFMPGTMTAIVGPSGAGKSTLARIAAGMLEPRSGVVRFGGRALDEWNHEALRRRLQYAPQSSSLITGTIKDNITMLDNTISEQDIEWGLELAGATEIVAHAGGLGAHVSSHHPCFSGGEIQRLALARALARRPDVLILDEITSALDNESERAVLQSLRGFGGSVVLVTHRRGSVARCDDLVQVFGGTAQAVTEDMLLAG